MVEITRPTSCSVSSNPGTKTHRKKAIAHRPSWNSTRWASTLYVQSDCFHYPHANVRETTPTLWLHFRTPTCARMNQVRSCSYPVLPLYVFTIHFELRLVYLNPSSIYVLVTVTYTLCRRKKYFERKLGLTLNINVHNCILQDIHYWNFIR